MDKKDKEKDKSVKPKSEPTHATVTEHDRAKEGVELENLLSTMQDKFGEGAIMKLGQIGKVDVDVIPTGSFSLDIALGVGGLPKGRVVEIYGPESSGKTTLALNVV